MWPTVEGQAATQECFVGDVTRVRYEGHMGNQKENVEVERGKEPQP